MTYTLRDSMPKSPLALVVALLLALPALLAPAARAQAVQDPAGGPPPAAYVIEIEGALNAGHLALFQRALDAAAPSDAAIVIVFDTPGGELTRMRQLADAIDTAVQDGVHVWGFVDDQALSAGVWLAIACESLYMRERSTIGSAQAVTLSPGGMQPAPEKIASSYRAWVRAWAEAHGRDPLLAQAMIDEETEVRRVRIDGVERLISGAEWNDLVERGETPELMRTVVQRGEMAAFTGEEARRYGFADALAESIDEVLTKQGLAGARYEELEFSRREQWLAQLWSLRLLLLFLGLFFGYVELKIPGFGIPGVLSLLAFAIMFTGQYLVGLADVPHIVMAVLGLLLVAAELFVLPGMIWPGLIGALLLVTGLLMSQVGPGIEFSSAWDREILFDATWQLTLTATVALMAIWGISRFLPKTPVLSRLVLAGGAGTEADALPEARADRRLVQVGARGTALTTLRPVGKVALAGDRPGVEHEARSEAGIIEPGTAVRVVEARGGRLVVAPATETPGTTDSASPA